MRAVRVMYVYAPAYCINSSDYCNRLRIKRIKPLSNYAIKYHNLAHNAGSKQARHGAACKHVSDTICMRIDQHIYDAAATCTELCRHIRTGVGWQTTEHYHMISHSTIRLSRRICVRDHFGGPCDGWEY